MKNNFFNKIFFAFIMLIGIISCEERENIIVEPNSSPILMDLSTEKLVLNENFPANPALTVTWKQASYTAPVEMKYSLEVSSTESFENPYVLTSTLESQNYATFTNKELNEAAKKIGLIPYVAKNMYFRVKSYIGSNNNLQQLSVVTSVLITPYAASPTYEYTDLFLIGDATAGGWDNAITNMNLYPLLKTSNSKIYQFTGLFKAGGFKIIKNKGSWDAQYGSGGAGLLSVDGGSGNISISQEGYYKLTINTATLTYTLDPVSAPIKTYDSISIIGTVNGNWNNDTQLTKSSFDPHMWKISKTSLKAGEFKFRANNAWDNSWGLNSEFFGTAILGGDNIPLTSDWDYDVYFNDATGDYTIIPVQ